MCKRKSGCNIAGRRLTKQQIERFQKKIYAYYQAHGRHDMPWRICHEPYHVVVSEIMLQQTQVGRVVVKFPEFIKEFADFGHLTRADLKSVLQVWQGLGYNRRTIALHKLAKIIMDEHAGKVPTAVEELQKLPGIGYNTACSIAAFAFNTPVVFIETNIRTVYIHEFFADKNGVSDAEILSLVEQSMEIKNPRKWYYALMDYGVMLKKTTVNPSRRSAHYRTQSKFEGSSRQLRGKIVKLITQQPATAAALVKATACDGETIAVLLADLVQEGFFVKTGRKYHVR